MKQSKQTSDAQKVNDLLKKLQESYLGTKNNVDEEKKTKTAAQDRELQDKLKNVLDNAEDTAEQPEAATAEEPKAQEVPTPAEQPTEVKKEKSKPKKQSAKKADKKEAEQKESPQPPAEETTAAAGPPIQDAEPIAEFPKSEEAVVRSVPSKQKKKTEKASPKAEKAEAAVPSIPVTIATPALSGVSTPEPEQEASVQAPPVKGESPATAEPSAKKEASKPIPAPVQEKPKEKPVAPASEVKSEKKEPKKEAPKSVSIPVQKKPTESPVAPASEAKSKQDEQPKAEEPIVIKPKEATPLPNETIVIRPRVQSKQPVAPQAVTEEAPKQPIQIGKKSVPAPKAAPPSVTLPKGTAPVKRAQKDGVAPTETRPAEKAPSSAPKQKKSADKQARQPEHKRPAPVKKQTASVSQPRPLPKKPRPMAKPASQKNQEERLDEFLDEHLNDALEIALEDELDTAAEAEEIPMDAPEPASAAIQQKTTAAARRRLQKQQEEEAKMSAMELARKRSGLTEDDIAMIFELGYEYELGRLVGYDVMKKLKNDHLRKVGRSNRKHYRTALGYRGEEYAGSEQRAAVLAAYFHDRKRLVLCAVFTALLTFVLMFLDMPYLIGGGALSAFSAAYPALLPIASVLLLLLCAWLSLKKLVAGLCSFFKFAPSPYSVNAILLPVCIVYDILRIAVFPQLFPVNFIMALSLMLTQLLELLRLRSELKIFQLISTDSEKTVLEDATPRKKKLRQGEKIVKIINDDLGREMYRVRKANQITGFFRRFNSNEAASLPFTLFLCATLLLSLLTSVVRAVQTDSVYEALSAFMATLLIGAPFSAQIGFLYPLIRANGLLLQRNCALLGEEAVSEYDRHQRLIFRDEDLYQVEKKAELSVRRGDDLRRDLRLAGILFRKVNGTLKALGQTGPMVGLDDPRVSILRITETGLEAIVDNKYHMLAGDSDFLQKSGVRTPAESADQALRRNERTALMYVAIDGAVKLSYEIEYRSKKSFEEHVDLLAEYDASVSIFTYDPNISNAFLQSSRPDEEILRVYKPGRFEPEEVTELIDTGAVALGSSKDIVYPLIAAKIIGRIRKTALRAQLIASIVGAVGILLLPLLNLSMSSTVGTVLLYQLFWSLLSIITTNTELRKHTLLS